MAKRRVMSSLWRMLRRGGGGLQGSSRDEGERGQISLLILGFTVIARMLTIGAVDVRPDQLARTRLAAPARTPPPLTGAAS